MAKCESSPEGNSLRTGKWTIYFHFVDVPINSMVMFHSFVSFTRGYSRMGQVEPFMFILVGGLEHLDYLSIYWE